MAWIRKPRLTQYIVELIGPSVRLISLEDGWPAHVKVDADGKVFQVAMYGTNITSHIRKPYEVRLQKPDSSKPIQPPEGLMPLIVGLDRGLHHDEAPVLVTVDARNQVGKRTRNSLLFNQSAIDDARKFGWGVYTSKTGEVFTASLPILFPEVLTAISRGVSGQLVQVGTLLVATGIVEHSQDTPTVERAKQTVNVLVRNEAFRKRVREAYGHRCALCGLDWGLVEAAHIYPVRAPSSPDEVWNGIALCPNHHAAFDAHLIWLEPGTGILKLHPDLEQAAAQDRTLNILIQPLFTKIVRPAAVGDEPRADMFKRRYEFFEGRYDWAKH
jgi:hypothetical protein